MASDSGSVKSLAEWQSDFNVKAASVLDLIGSAVTYRCSVCRKLSSHHTGGDVAGCTDSPLDDDELALSLQLQVRALTQLMSQLSISHDLVDANKSLKDENSALKIENADSKLELADTKRECNEAKQELADVTAEKDLLATELASDKNTLSDLETTLDNCVDRCCYLWRGYIAGKFDAQTVKNRFDAAFNYDLSLDSIPPVAGTPPGAAIGGPVTPGAGISGAGVSGAVNTGPVVNPFAGGIPATPSPAGVPAPAAFTPAFSGGAAAAATGSTVGDAADGNMVGKSAKSIKVEFKHQDSPIQHLQKEQSLIDEIELLFPQANVQTQISITISHCDKEVRQIAMAVKSGKNGAFLTVAEFLTAFRMERYPSFHEDCRRAFTDMRQRFSESAMQFYFRFSYLLNAMGRNKEDYVDEFLKKLLFPQVVAHVKYWPRAGRTLQMLAQHCSDIESEMGIRKKHKKWGNDDVGTDELDICAVNSPSRGRGQSRGRGSRRGRGGRGGRGGSRSSNSSFARIDAWGLGEFVCWHCFQQHSKDEREKCLKSSCLFCKAPSSSHRSAFCPSAPSTKEQFQAAVKLPS